ncbi:MAG: hypothetical protein JWO97_3674 [Acidobacteria bacterium]|nr:hypothetical protein [Acidobacteriota bacterium]
MTDFALPAAAEAGHRNRNFGLVAFGIVQLVLGAATGVLALAVSASDSPAPELASNIVLFGTATLYFFAAGIGSIRGRRWARALSVAVTAIWLAIGTIATLVTLTVGPGSASLLRYLVAGIIVPLALLLFYRSRDVGVTCDLRDPEPRWTDRVPLAVLAVVLVMAFSSVTLLANLGNASAQLPAALHGAPAGIAVFAMALLFAYLALQLYLLKQSAWWTTMMLHVLGAIAAVASLMTGSGVRLGALWAIMIAAWLAYAVFLVRIRRYFIGVLPRTRAADTRRNAI